jgi:hypothetical protein
MDARKLGLSLWVLRPCMFACFSLHWAQRREYKMPLQIATACFALLFVAVLMLSSHRFVDSRASNLNPAVATRNAATQVATLP